MHNKINNTVLYKWNLLKQVDLKSAQHTHTHTEEKEKGNDVQWWVC